MGHDGFINRLWMCEHVRQWQDSKTEKLDDLVVQDVLYGAKNSRKAQMI